MFVAGIARRKQPALFAWFHSAGTDGGDTGAGDSGVHFTAGDIEGGGGCAAALGRTAGGRLPSWRPASCDNRGALCPRSLVEPAGRLTGCERDNGGVRVDGQGRAAFGLVEDRRTRLRGLGARGGDHAVRRFPLCGAGGREFLSRRLYRRDGSDDSDPEAGRAAETDECDCVRGRRAYRDGGSA